jgi:hypothetical protein
MRGINETKADYFKRIGKTVVAPKAVVKEEPKKEVKSSKKKK